MTYLPASWQTDRRHGADGVLENVPRLMVIFNTCSYVGPWDPTFKIYPETEFTRSTAHPSMTPPPTPASSLPGPSNIKDWQSTLQ